MLSESYGRFLDELLSGMIASHAGPVLLLSATAEGSDTGRRAWSIWLGEGSPTLGGRTDSVVPAALRLLGVEPAQDMWGGGNGPASYGARPRWAPTAPRRALDLDRLESLGYIGGS